MHTSSQASPKTAIIIGGGLVGLSCALNLQKKGIQTHVLERSAARLAASWGNAGHIAVEQVEPLASRAMIKTAPRRLFWRGGALCLPLRDIAAWLPFSLKLLAASQPDRFATGKEALGQTLAQALPAWRRLLAEANAPHLLREDGHFIVWETPASAAAGRAAWSKAEIGNTRFRDATPDELAKISSLINTRPAGAIRFEGSGQIADLLQLGQALEARIDALGGHRVQAGVQAIQRRDHGTAVLLDTGEVIEAEIVIVTAGHESGRLLEPLGYTVPIIAERGYHLQTSETSWPLDMPPVVFEDRSMIVTRFQSGLRAASFVEFARAGSPPDSRKWARLRNHIRALGLPFGEPATEWMGARPTLPDYLPAIGRCERTPGLFYAFGHQHLGLTLAAITGEAIGALVSGEAPVINIDAFSIQRFQR